MTFLFDEELCDASESYAIHLIDIGVDFVNKDIFFWVVVNETFRRTEDDALTNVVSVCQKDWFPKLDMWNVRIEYCDSFGKRGF